MATVLLAFDPKLNLDVALKVVPPHLAYDRTFVARFRREGQTLAKLNHPNILRLFEMGEDEVNHLYFLVLEYLSGGTLSNRLTGRPWGLRETLELLRPVASALDYAHQCASPVIHRDLKPSNIMFGEFDRPIVTDFGVARLLAPQQTTSTEGSALTLTAGQVVGTPAYMAPEQADGRPVSQSTDLYALGMLAYELLVGRVAYQADTPMATLLQVVSKPLPLPRQTNPLVSIQTEQVLLKALAKDPSNRYSSGAELVDALEKSNEPRGEATLIAATIPQRNPNRHMGRHQAFAAVTMARKPSMWLSGLVAILIVALGAFVHSSMSGSVPTPLPVATDASQDFAAVVTPTSALAAATVTPTMGIIARPTSAPAATRSPAPTSTPTPADAWQTIQPELDAAWNDWPSTTDLLSMFLARYPDYGPAREKMYAALLFYGEGLTRQDRPKDAMAQFEKAGSYVPGHPANGSLTADDVWPGVASAVDHLWGSNWPRSIQLLEAFRERFPDDADAKNRLYDGYVQYAEALGEDGRPGDAADVLDHARVLLPDRAEAEQAALALTPTAAPRTSGSSGSGVLPRTVQPITSSPRSVPPDRATSPPAPIQPAVVPTKCIFGTPGCGR
jgi:serine/threonine protein kinase